MTDEMKERVWANIILAVVRSSNGKAFYDKSYAKEMFNLFLFEGPPTIRKEPDELPPQTNYDNLRGQLTMLLGTGTDATDELIINRLKQRLQELDTLEREIEDSLPI